MYVPKHGMYVRIYSMYVRIHSMYVRICNARAYSIYVPMHGMYVRIYSMYVRIYTMYVCIYLSYFVFQGIQRDVKLCVCVCEERCARPAGNCANMHFYYGLLLA